ncbi:MAG: copper amine oxidase N-terminal domain-containing protein, partial [Clostridiales bacterium]|nr:copper amine oxidase N-terminal domain-containing protein [Clostridiales bacterium]
TITLDGQTVSLTIGQTAPGMDVPAQIIDGRTMVPVRYIAEALGAFVDWNDATRTITIIN